MRTGHSSGPAHETHHLPLLDCIAYIDHDLRLMPKATVNTPAVVDDRRIPADSQRRSKDDLTWRRCKDLQSLASTEIQSTVEPRNLQVCVDDFVRAASSIPGCEAIGVRGGRGEYTCPVASRRSRSCERNNVFQFGFRDGGIDKAWIIQWNFLTAVISRVDEDHLRERLFASIRKCCFNR